MADNYIFDLDPGVTRAPVSYNNRYGITLAADLYRPTDFGETLTYPGLVIGRPANHIDLYDRTDRVPFDTLDEFFMANLASGTTRVAAVGA